MEQEIHPQTRNMLTRLCEAFNIPITTVKLRVWQEKLKIPDPDLLRETYEFITDGKSNTLNKMPTVAEFMSIYKAKQSRKEKEKNEDGNKTQPIIDHNQAKEMFAKINEAMKTRQVIRRGLCALPVTDWEGGQQFTITRDDDDKDYVLWHNHPRNEK